MTEATMIPHQTGTRRLTWVVRLPLRVESEANMRGHWSAGYRRAREQKRVVTLALQAACRRPPPPPVRVLLRRCGKRELDGDNLQRALKAIRDAVAAWLGVDDGDRERVTFEYEQRFGAKVPYGVEIEVT